MNILRKNDKVIWRGSWGLDAPKEVVVLNIEKIKPGQRDANGIKVEEISWDDDFVVDLDNGKWAYSYQVSPTKI